jgi:hypothetical protein
VVYVEECTGVLEIPSKLIEQLWRQAAFDGRICSDCEAVEAIEHRCCFFVSLTTDPEKIDGEGGAGRGVSRDFGKMNFCRKSHA